MLVQHASGPGPPNAYPFVCVLRSSACAVQLLGPHSLIRLPDPCHKYLRALAQPAFTPEAVASTVPLITKIVETYFNKWEAASEPVKGADELKALTFDIVLQVSVVPLVKY